MPERCWWVQYILLSKQQTVEFPLGSCRDDVVILATIKNDLYINDDYNFCNAILSLAKPHSNAKRRSSQGHKTFAARLSHYSTKFMNSKRDLKLEQGPVDPRREWIKKNSF